MQSGSHSGSQPGSFSYDEPQVPAAQQPGVIAASSANAPLIELPGNADVNVERLFEPNRSVVNDAGQSSSTALRTVGELNLASGIIGVRDFTLDPWRLAPLARRIDAGRYPVEVVEAFDQVGAIRVTIDASVKPETWLAAATIRNKHYSPVDLGSASIFDMVGFLKMSAGHKRDLFAAHGLGEVGRPTATLLSMVEPDDALVVASGGRESGYPAYWGVGAAGEIAALVVDFLVLAKMHLDVVSVPCSVEQLDQPIFSADLAARGLSVTVTQNVAREIVVSVAGSEAEIGVELGGPVEGDWFKHRLLVRDGKTRNYVFSGDPVNLDHLRLSIACGYSN